MAIVTNWSAEHLFLFDHPLANVRCPNCGEEFKSADGSYYASCPKCGLKLFTKQTNLVQKKCSHCNILNPKDASYCRLCGEKLGHTYVFNNKIELVDLGLSVLWATEPLISERGTQWGEIFMETIWRNFYGTKKYSEYLNGDYWYKTVGAAPNREIGDKYYDVVNKYFLGHGRTPTRLEFEELLTKCTWEPQSRLVKGTADAYPVCQNGFLITGLSGKSIFMGTKYNGTARFWSSDESDKQNAYVLSIGIRDAQNALLNRYGARDKNGFMKQVWDDGARSGRLFHEISTWIKKPVGTFEQDKANAKLNHDVFGANWPVFDK